MRRNVMSKAFVWRWQDRFAEEDVDSLLREITRCLRLPHVEPEVVKRVVALMLGRPPVEVRHWTLTAAFMAEVSGTSVSSMIGSFCSQDQRRQWAMPVITSRL